MRVKLGWLVVVLVVSAGALVWCSGVAFAAGGGRSGSLTVSVQGLARGVLARVQVSGPGGFSRRVSRSGATLSHLPAGRYVLVIEPTSGKGVQWSAGKHKQVIVKVAAKPERVSVSYTVGVRAGTVHVSAGAVKSASVSAHGGSFVLTGAGAKGVRPGGYLVLGITQHTPKGFLGHVTKVTKTKTGTVEVTATTASLGDVLPEADVQFNIPAKHVSTTATQATRRTRRGGLSPDGSFLHGVTCSDGAQLNLSGDAEASIGLHISITHHLLSWHPSVGAEIEATADQSASVSASLTGKASCELEDTPIGPNIPLGEFPVDVPFTPIVFIASPELQFSISGSADADAAATVSASESAHADAGIKAVNTKITPFANFSHQFTYQAPSYSADASIDGEVHARVTVGIDDTDSGPDFEIDNALDLGVDTTANPCWQINDKLSAAAGLTIGDIVDTGDKTVYGQTFPVAHSQQSCAKSTIATTNPGNQTTPVGTPVKVPIHPVDSAGLPTTSTATGLPAGTTIDPSTGTITGTPTTAGSSNVVVTTTDPSGGSTTTSFAWTISVSAPSGGSPWSGTVTAQSQSVDTDGSATCTVDAAESVSLTGSVPGPALFNAAGANFTVPGGSVYQPFSVVSASYTAHCTDQTVNPTNGEPCTLVTDDVGSNFQPSSADPAYPSDPTFHVAVTYAPDQIQPVAPAVFAAISETKTGCGTNTTNPPGASTFVIPAAVGCQSDNGIWPLSDDAHPQGTCSSSNASGGSSDQETLSWNLTLSPTVDSDGDGYPDVQELAAGTSPIDASSHP